jgi:3-dehydroquinate synthase
MAQGSAEHIAAHFAEMDMVSEVSDLRLNCDGKALTDHMLHDKKMDAGTLPFLLMRGIGETFVAKDVELADVARFLDEELAK